MSLGVLNNLSAMYAANNLSNTQNSLSKTLQQLSSGSKINSGADDAAGLSLVNGLQANATALSQSQTNAQEGVGLLQVADGALSQVTNLLNRAVTLATEVSNGTLNSSQQSAANQEYQSILSEINNIGSTTTYNQRQVFGTTTNIYTGDSSSQSASMNSLNIRSLSSANIGDTAGVMSYSNGQGSVFIDLSGGGKNAALTDSLAAAQNITITTLDTGANGAVQTASHTISVGGSGTVNDLINSINNSGLGLTAKLTTQAASGVSGGTGTDTGIQITSSVGAIGSGGAPGVLGTITTNNGAADTFQDNPDALTIITSDGVAHKIALNGATDTGTPGANADTVTQLTANINAANLGVTASANAGTVTLTSTDPGVQVVSSIYDNTASHLGSLGFTAATYYSVGVADGGTVLNDSSTTVATTTLGNFKNGTSGGIATITFADNAGQSLSGTNLTSQNNAQVALTDLNAAISAAAAQDGYVGAQINTLNAVSQVMSTQQQNIVAAQNAVQATDYASAASNMSKYQILSQTGISALAQANSMSQLVTKLLQ